MNTVTDYAVDTILAVLRPMVSAGTTYLGSLIAESDLRIRLMEMEAQQMQATQEPTKKEPKGLMKAPFGYCPECGEPGEGRGTYITKCTQGHCYNSEEFTILQKPEHRKDEE
jgi:hypothetical protein